MTAYRFAIAGAAAVAVVAGVVALVAASTAEDAESFPDAFDAATVHVVRGPFLERYRDEGGPAGRLGLPVTDEEAAAFGPARATGADREVGFRHGVIYLDSRTGHTDVGVWYAYTPLTPPPSR